MTDISPLKKKIQSEEVLAQAAISSGTGNKIGASVNFILERETIHRTWQLNGIYGTSTGAQTAVDGSIPVEFDMEICGFYMANEIAGSSGTTEIDIRKQAASGTSGTSIFTTRPSLSTAAGNRAKLQANYNPAETIHNPTGSTMPVFSSFNLNKGEALFLDFVTRQANGQSLTVTLICRPR